MSQIPDHTSMSLALSEVLNELGLNEEIVSRTRGSYTLTETMNNICWKLTDTKVILYYFGSQIEGSTTRGLESDAVTLYCTNKFNLIDNWRDWKSGVDNLLMVYNVSTPPGYCRLQVLRSDVPLPQTEKIDQHYIRDNQVRLFLKTTRLTSEIMPGQEQYGPAFSRQGHPGLRPSNHVLAFACHALLEPVEQWLSQARNPWPTEEMKTYIANSPCFVVPVGSRQTANAELEWQISTLLAERCLMFSLNIVQIQVYVLMKMLLKNRINTNIPGKFCISSFMCKNVLLHCIQNTDHNLWQSHKLIQCLLYCLSGLYVCVLNENCPHFIISTNNLMAGRFTSNSKQKLVKHFRLLFQDFVSHGILSLHIDDIANRLVIKLNNVMSVLHCPPDDTECQKICVNLFYTCAVNFRKEFHSVLQFTKDQISEVQRCLKLLQEIDRNGDLVERSACRLLTPNICTTLGSLLASRGIQTSNSVSAQALSYFNLGLNSDVASSKLKLASVFYMLGDLIKAETILRNVDNRNYFYICGSVCPCRHVKTVVLPSRAETITALKNEFNTLKLAAYCVIFLATERSCVPQELQYEMYRFTADDLAHRSIEDDWMDWAVVDSLPFLHFLQYKVYSRLQRLADQQRALNKLVLDIQREPNLGHRETALNLLGQCFEQESKWNEAMRCYCWSLDICPRNNAAKFHVCRLMYRCFSLRN